MLNLRNFIVGQLNLFPTTLRHIVMLTFCVVCVSGTPPVTLAAGETPARKPFHVFTKREGNCTRFFVDNREANEVTATFELQTLNLKGSTNFPFSGTYPANQVTEAFSVAPINPDEQWNYSYTSHYTLGSTLAKHDDSCVYRLPFAAGTSFKVTQGYNGQYSHHGSDQFAIDFKMPVGTPIYAARGGVVAKIKDDSSKGGADRKYENQANYVLIRHDDGTLGNYAHLSKGGAKVAIGQRVEAGDLIALSGNTGFSSGAHLHFSVFKTRDGKGRLSIPVRFETADDSAVTLVEGKTYRSSPVKPGTILAIKGDRAEGPPGQFQGGQNE
jgi:murein DD-endopeptidase MepM/ murein hydrolase activator NlpD